MNVEEFKSLIEKHPLLVAYFSTDTCNVCKVLRPQVKKITEAVRGAHFVYINTENEPELSGQYLVFTVPTIIVFASGQEAQRFNRYLSLQEFEAYLQRLSWVIHES